MAATNGAHMTDTGKHRAMDAQDPNAASLTTQESLRAIVIDVLKSKGMGDAQATRAEAYGEELVKKAAKQVPPWVGYLFVLFGVPSLGAFYATAQAIWGMPREVAALKTDLAAHVEAESKALAEIKTLLQRPASQPK